MQPPLLLIETGVWTVYSLRELTLSAFETTRTQLLMTVTVHLRRQGQTWNSGGLVLTDHIFTHLLVVRIRMHSPAISNDKI